MCILLTARCLVDILEMNPDEQKASNEHHVIKGIKDKCRMQYVTKHACSSCRHPLNYRTRSITAFHNASHLIMPVCICDTNRVMIRSTSRC